MRKKKYGSVIYRTVNGAAKLSSAAERLQWVQKAGLLIWMRRRQIANNTRLALVQLHFNNMKRLNATGERHRAEITL